jgi:hypothetical protein
MRCGIGGSSPDVSEDVPSTAMDLSEKSLEQPARLR